MEKGSGVVESTESRQSARSVLENYIEHKKREVRSLEILLEYLPWDSLDKKQEELLWDHFSSMPAVP